MCGILAIFDRNGPRSLERIKAGLATLHHRGPDARDTWESPDHTACLGHTRLSIIDLTTGGQPIANEDGSIHAVVNGEFYDFERIRADLESRGHRFRTHSDSEILLHLYEEYGTACVHHLRGEYAFILWDGKAHRVFSGRDRFGIKPLFYARHGTALIFASEAKALHAVGVPASWDETGFFETFTFTGTGPRTLFSGVELIPPGHYLVARANEVSVHKYWDFDFPREEDLPTDRSDAEYAEEFHALLENAVRTRLRADVPVGCYLSGGIDSCSVLALMAKHATNSIRAFSLGFDHELYDEGPIAREMAEKVGAEFTLIPISQATIAADLGDAVWHAETMFINGGSAGKYALSRTVRDAGYKVVLTGEGSDEIVAGYPFFRADLLRYGSPNQSGTDGIASLSRTNTATRGFFVNEQAAAPIPAFVEGMGFVPSIIAARKTMMLNLAPALTRAFDCDGFLGNLMNRLDLNGQMDGRHVVNRSLYLNNKTVLPSYILVALGDRIEMGHSIEGRLPFLDHHLVEYTRRLPMNQKINNGVEKYVLREAMKPLLTETVYKRQKHPFLSPPALLKPTEPLHELMQDTLRGSALDRVPFFRREGVVRILDAAPALEPGTQIALEFPLMQMLTACLLAERFKL